MACAIKLFSMAAELIITADTAAKIWQALTKELRRPGAEQQKKMAAAAMANDNSTDHIESKAIIAKVGAEIVFALS